MNMEQKRFVETGKASFFGEYLYDQVVPANHFLRKLQEGMDWRQFTENLIKLYKGEGLVGRPPFDPALVLKMEQFGFFHIFVSIFGIHILCRSSYP